MYIFFGTNKENNVYYEVGKCQLFIVPPIYILAQLGYYKAS